MLTAVLWDLDGTLVDSEPAHAAALDAALAELGLAVGPAFHRRSLGASEDSVHRALVAEFGPAIALGAWRDLKWSRYQVLASHVATRPGMPALVARLAAAGVPMAVVSNSTRAEVALNLAATGLDQLLPVTITRDDVLHGKPDPEGYLAAAAQLGVAPAACIVVEDSPAGAAAGLAAGMTTVFHPLESGLDAPDGALSAGPDGLAPLLSRLGLPGVAEATDSAPSTPIPRRSPCVPPD